LQGIIIPVTFDASIFDASTFAFNVENGIDSRPGGCSILPF
jgi:hypothetical protein